MTAPIPTPAPTPAPTATPAEAPTESPALASAASNPLEVLRGMYAAEAAYLAAGGPGKASFALLAPYFSPDVVLHQADGLPYAGTWRGHDGMARFFVAMSETWERFDMVAQEITPAGDQVFVHTRIHARARATGRELTFPILQAIAFQDGRITEVRPFYWDTAAVRDATAHD